MILVKKTDINVDGWNEGLPDSISYMISHAVPMNEPSIDSNEVREADTVYLSYSTYESLGEIIEKEIQTLKKFNII